MQVEITYKSESFKKTFVKNSQIVFHDFTLPDEKGYYDSVSVIYTALEDNTIYSSRIKPASKKENDDNGKNDLTVDPNQPSYVHLNKG